MPKKDIYHEVVKNALIKDGWIITHDPLIIPYGHRQIYVDLGAKQLIGAEKEGRKIAVEVKSFIGKSDVNELENAIGQYVFASLTDAFGLRLYYHILSEREPERSLYLAVSEDAFSGIFSEAIGQLLIKFKGVWLCG